MGGFAWGVVEVHSRAPLLKVNSSPMLLLTLSDILGADVGTVLCQHQHPASHDGRRQKLEFLQRNIAF